MDSRLRGNDEHAVGKAKTRALPTLMWFDDPEEMSRFQSAWSAVRIARPVACGLFTFGESLLPYYMVCGPEKPDTLVSVSKGEVRITRPLIITPNNAPPELHNFFEEHGEEAFVSHMLARTATFRHLKLNNVTASKQFTSDSVEEVVARLNRDLDREEEDQVAILTAPAPLAGIALLRYAADRVVQSAPGNVQELRERGFLP